MCTEQPKRRFLGLEKERWPRAYGNVFNGFLMGLDGFEELGGRGVGG